MKKLTFTALFSLISTSTYALPNIWTSGTGQGWIEYNITDTQNQTLTISCNAGWDETTDHKINLDNKEIDGAAFVIDGNAYYPLSMPTSTRIGANDWDEFTTAIAKAKGFEIYINDKKVAEFKPTPQSVKSKASSLASCNPLF